MVVFGGNGGNSGFLSFSIELVYSQPNNAEDHGWKILIIVRA